MKNKLSIMLLSIVLASCEDKNYTSSTTHSTPSGPPSPPERFIEPSKLPSILGETSQKELLEEKADPLLKTYVLDWPNGRMENNPINLNETKYYTTWDAIIHWLENRKVNSDSAKLLSVKDILKQDTLPMNTNNNGVIIDAWGNSPKQPASLSANTNQQYTALSLKDAQLNCATGANIALRALNLQNASLLCSTGSALFIETIQVSKDSKISGGLNIGYVASKEGVSLDHLKSNRSGFSWVKSGFYYIAGSVDSLKISPNVSLVVNGSSANIEALDLNGGNVNISTEDQLSGSSLNIQAPSSICVDWNKPINNIPQRALLNYPTIVGNNSVNVVLSNVSADIPLNTELRVLQTKSKKDNFLQKQDKFGIGYDIKSIKEDQAMVWVVTLTRKGMAESTVNALSAGGAPLAKTLLNTPDIGSTLSGLDEELGVSTLNAICGTDYTNPIRSKKLYYGIWHMMKSTQGVQMATIEQIGHQMLGVGYTLSPTTNVSMSYFTSKSKTALSESVYGVHASYRQIALDNLISVDRSEYVCKINYIQPYEVGNKKSFISAGFNVMQKYRHGASNTPLGYFELKPASEQHVGFNIELQHKFTTMMDIQIALYRDIYVYRSNYEIELNKKNYCQRGHYLNSEWNALMVWNFYDLDTHLSLGIGCEQGKGTISPTFDLGLTIEL